MASTRPSEGEESSAAALLNPHALRWMRIKLQERASDITSTESGPTMLAAQGSLWYIIFEQLGMLIDLDEAINCLRQAISLTSDGHVEKPERLSNLGNYYQVRFQRLGVLQDINNAIDHLAQAVPLTPVGHEDLPGRLIDLGNSYHRRFTYRGDPTDINKAIECLLQAMQFTSDDAGKSRLLSNLGSAYRSRFERLGELSDINRSLDCLIQAVSLAPDDRADKPTMLSNLGNSHQRRFERLGEAPDANKAIECNSQAVSLLADGHPGKPGCLNNLGSSLLDRFELLGDPRDINEAVSYLRRAVSLIPNSHPDKSKMLGNLGGSCLRRFQHLGELADINNAIDCLLQAVSLTPDDHAGKPGRLSNLGSSYQRRFEYLGQLSDSDRASCYLLQALLLTPDNHPGKPVQLSNLGNSYRSRFERTIELPDINKAIDYLVQSVSLTPDGHLEEPARLNNLGYSYHRRFELLGDVQDINEAVRRQLRAVSLTPNGHAEKPGRLGNLGGSYNSRFEHLGELTDAEQAIECLAQAVLLIPDGHACKPAMLNNMGSSYQRRFEHLSEFTDISAAIAYFQKAAESATGPPYTRFIAAREWARLTVKHNIPNSLFAYQRAMELVPQLVWVGTTIHRRYELISEMGSVARDAASCAISLGAYDCALEWLEEGRSIVWNQILQLRTPLDNLSIANPSLAQRLKEIGCELENAGSRSESGLLSTDAELDLEKDARHHHALAAEWDQLLEQARAISGFQDFMCFQKANELKKAAKDGPVVVINVHSVRCDALILRPGISGIGHAPLNTFSMDKAIDIREQLSPLVGHRGFSKATKPGVLKTENDWKGPLGVLWSDVVKPVLDFLGYRHEPTSNQLPHITWCTTGPISFLPLHAAGRYDESQLSAFDLVISSYTPTLSALLASAPQTSHRDSGLVAVGQESTPGQSPLPCTRLELAAIKERIKTTRYFQLDGAKATVDKVLKAMDEYSWVHLACHATQNLDDPTQSAFHLHEGDLVLAEITKRAFKNKGLAFLSACQTATGDRRLPDEAVHLAAGMLMSGFPSVIATMWSIWDEDGPEVAGQVYSELLKDGKMDCTGVAKALHKAVGCLREKVGAGAVARWAPFIHIGL